MWLALFMMPTEAVALGEGCSSLFRYSLLPLLLLLPLPGLVKEDGGIEKEEIFQGDCAELKHWEEQMLAHFQVRRSSICHTTSRSFEHVLDRDKVG